MMRAASIFFCAALLCVACAAHAACPSPDVVEPILREVSKTPDLTVTGVGPSGMPGLCEVTVYLKGATRLAYVDEKAEHVIFGELIEAKTGKNLTREAAENLNRLTPDELKHLETLTAFSVGTGPRVFYFVTDPDCAYCKRSEDDFAPLVASGEVTVRYVLGPHAKEAREVSIAVICEGSGLQGYHEKRKTGGACPAGAKKVDDTTAFLKEKALTMTPTFIFMDGRAHVGSMGVEDLRRYLAEASK